jgi:hypothetical protein
LLSSLIGNSIFCLLIVNQIIIVSIQDDPVTTTIYVRENKKTEKLKAFSRLKRTSNLFYRNTIAYPYLIIIKADSRELNKKIESVDTYIHSQILLFPLLLR